MMQAKYIFVSSPKTTKVRTFLCAISSTLKTWSRRSRGSREMCSPSLQAAREQTCVASCRLSWKTNSLSSEADLNSSMSQVSSWLSLRTHAGLQNLAYFQQWLCRVMISDGFVVKPSIILLRWLIRGSFVAILIEGCAHELLQTSSFQAEIG